LFFALYLYGPIFAKAQLSTFFIHYRGADKSLARPTSYCILFDASLVIYINSTNIPPIMIINRIHENQKSSVAVACFLPGWAKDLSSLLLFNQGNIYNYTCMYNIILFYLYGALWLHDMRCMMILCHGGGSINK